MTQNTMATNTGQTENLIKWVSLVLSAIASWIAINAFIATVVKQDPLLILLMTATAIAIAGVLNYMIRRIRLGIVPVIIALVGSGVLAVVAWSLLASSGVTSVKISINDPQDGASVTLRYLAKGTVSDADARVYVIVHPLTVSEMWVQQPPIGIFSIIWGSSGRSPTVPVVTRSGDRPQQVRPRKIEKIHLSWMHKVIGRARSSLALTHLG